MNKYATKYFSNMQEKEVANRVGGKPVKMSGAGKFEKTDVLTERFSIECKTAMTEKKSFAIKKQWIDKVREESFSNNRPYWAITFNFGGERNEKENYYVIPEEEFIVLKEMLESGE